MYNYEQPIVIDASSFILLYCPKLLVEANKIFKSIIYSALTYPIIVTNWL